MERSRQVHRQRQLEALLGARWHASCAEGLLRWHRAVTAGAARTAARSLAELRAQHDASMAAGRRALEGRRSDAIGRAIAIEGGVGMLLGLGGAWARWVRYVVAEGRTMDGHHAHEVRMRLTAESEELRRQLIDTERRLAAEAQHVEALGEELRSLAQHARASEKQAQQAQLATFSAAREKDAVAARFAEADLQLQLLRNQLDLAADERRRAENACSKIQTERDNMLAELRKAELELHALKAQSMTVGAHAQQQTARMIAETTELRRRLSAADAARERERQQAQKAAEAAAQVQGQLQMARETAAREAAAHELRRDVTQTTHALQLQARLDADNALALNAELLAFASRLDVEPPPPRIRHVSPLPVAGALSRARSPVKTARAF